MAGETHVRWIGRQLQRFKEHAYYTNAPRGESAGTGAIPSKAIPDEVLRVANREGGADALRKGWLWTTKTTVSWDILLFVLFTVLPLVFVVLRTALK